MRRRDIETLLHVAALVVVGSVVTRIEYRYGASLGEDGTRFALASHLLDGRVPYRTLLSHRPPGSYAFDALVMAIAGRTLGAQHLAAHIAGGLVYPLLVYVAGRALLQRAWLALAAGLGVILLFEPAPGLVLACSLVALVLASRWIRTGTPAALFVAGVAAGAEVAFSFGVAVSTFVAVVVTVLVRMLAGRRTASGTVRIPTLQPLLTFATGCVLGVVPLVIALAADRGIGTFLRYIPVVARRAAESVAALPVPGTSSVRFYLPILALPPLIALLARACSDEEVRADALTGVLLASAVALRFARAGVDPSHLAATLADAPLLVVWTVDWAAGRGGRIVLRRPDISLAGGVGLVAAAAWRLGADRPFMALVAPAAAIAAAGVPIGRSRLGGGMIRITAPVFALAAAIALPSIAPGRLAPDGGDPVKLSGALWPPALAEEVAEAAEELRSAAPKDRPVFVYPDGGLIYSLSGRRNPTSFVSLGRGAAGWEVRRALSELAVDEPAAVLVRYAGVARASRELTAITARLEEGYVETARLERPELWGVWVRRDAPEVCRRLVLRPYDHPAASDDDLRAIDRSRGREDAVLIQSSTRAPFRLSLDRGSYVRFAVDPSSSNPEAARSIDIVISGARSEVWRGTADGNLQRVVLPLASETGADIELHSPHGRRTVWRDPVVCSPR